MLLLRRQEHESEQNTKKKLKKKIKSTHELFGVVSGNTRRKRLKSIYILNDLISIRNISNKCTTHASV